MPASRSSGPAVEIAASRPLEVYADGDPIAELPACVRALPGAVRALVPADRASRTRRRPRPHPVGPMSALDVKILAARAVGERGPARRARRRHEPPRQDPHRAGPARHRAPRRPAAARLRRDLGDQRQDDDGGDGRLGAPARRRQLVHNRAGANMAGGVASTLAAAAGRHGSIAGELGLFEVDEFWLDRVGPQLRPRALLLANLFRDQLDRYGELDTIADRWAAMVTALPADAQLALNADDPLIADLGREPRRGDLLRGRGPVHGQRRDAARLGLQALPPLRRGLRLRRRLPRPPRPLPLSRLRPRAPGAGGGRRASDAARHPIGELHARHPARRASMSRCRCRASTTSTTRSGPPPCAWRSA